MTLAQIEARLAGHRLAVFGGFHADGQPGLPPGTETLLLIGPAEPGYWAHLTAQPEWQDGRPDPVDRWSRRVIGRLACDLGAKARFPFGGPPWHPFYDWALASGRAWASPLRLLVHDRAGLMVSYRGALALRQRIVLPPPSARPCDDCTRPCETACPVNVFGAGGYDTAACHAWLAGPGNDCMAEGCRARRACPMSQAYGRVAEQSAYHMRQFHQ